MFCCEIKSPSWAFQSVHPTLGTMGQEAIRLNIGFLVVYIRGDCICLWDLVFVLDKIYIYDIADVLPKYNRQATCHIR